MQLRREFRFEAAHTTTAGVSCQSLHGHGYRLRVAIAGDADPATGCLMDFDALAEVVRERVLARLDHGHLNDHLAVPTVENIAVWIWRRLEPHLPLAEVALWETPENGVVYRGESVAEEMGAAAR